MRVNHVKRAQKDQGTCESCGEAIPAGSAYKYIKPRYGGKRKRHESCPAWRPSEMTTAKIATAYAGQESAHDTLDTLDAPTVLDECDAFIESVKDALRQAVDAAEECAGDYQEGIDNLPEAFQETSSSAETAREKIEALESWQQDLEEWEPESDAPEVEEGDDDPAAELATWADEVLDSARSVIDGLEA